MNSSPNSSQLYTPAMMAEVLRVSVRAIRLWYRAGLLQPTRTVMKIPYFDYTALTMAKTFARWNDQGLTARSIVNQVTALCELSGISTAEGAGLSISLQGKRLVLSQGSLHLEASGQFQLAFDSQENEVCSEPITLKLHGGTNDIGSGSDNKQEFGSLAEMVENAIIAEENDDLDAAIQWYRTALAAFGSNADVCFQLAEVLYKSADLSGARERYYCAIELDPGLVEARANLGCVLAECGQLDLAVAAFGGALSQYPDYADVHFHLARTLEDAGRASEATIHWRRFIELAPASPWADEANSRLGLQPDLNFEG